MTNKIIALIFVLCIIPISTAQLSNPNDYPEGMCELASREFQNKFGGSMVLTMPFIDEQIIEGKYSGAWLNRIYIKGNNQYFYIDYPNQRIFNDKQTAISFYSNAFKNKFDNGIVEAKLFVYGEDNIPFQLILHY